MDFHLSQRGAHNSLQASPWDAVEKLMSNLWAPDKPDGLYAQSLIMSLHQLHVPVLKASQSLPRRR
jgi:hypothetical protein